MMRRVLGLFLAYCFCWISIAVAHDANDGSDEEGSSASTFRIAGYLPDYRFGNAEGGGINLNATAEFVDDLFLFSLAPQTQLGAAQMFQLCCLRPHHYEAARQAVAHASMAKTPVKLWITVGGAGRSHKLSQNPTALLGALQLLLNEHDYLRGVDWDGEDFRSHDDYEQYYRLVQRSAGVLHARNDNTQVSVTLHVGQTLPPAVYDAVDRINFMAYDLPPQSASRLSDIETAVDALEASGCPARKIFLGIPAYARHRQRRGDTKTYAELYDQVLRSHTTVEDSGAVRLDVSEYQAESPRTVTQKVQYAVARGLGGVFFWELGQDKQTVAAPGGILLQAAAAAVPKAADETVQGRENASAEDETPQDEL